MLTEEDARTKWCPFIRVRSGDSTDEGVASINRPWHGNHYFCIGSQCMAWRIAEKGWEAELTDATISQKRLIEAGVRKRTTERRGAYDWLIVHALGYCGLAGKP